MHPSWWGPARLGFEDPELAVIDTTSTPLTWDRLLFGRETFLRASYVLIVLSSVIVCETAGRGLGCLTLLISREHAEHTLGDSAMM